MKILSNPNSSKLYTKIGFELDCVRRRDPQSLRLCCLLQGLPSPQAMWSPGLLAWHPGGSNALPKGRAGMYNSSCGLCQNALKSIKSIYCCTSLLRVDASVCHLHDQWYLLIWVRHDWANDIIYISQQIISWTGSGFMVDIRRTYWVEKCLEPI